ncbi:phosphatase 2C-domain-containing protein [Chlamydoabsidia padenii]|nr:phosphatase 2C-domain-containing protein [Chlamydoabsidia padenii]
MGQTLSEPIVDKKSHSETDVNYTYGLSSMQGWRFTMEDAHAAVLKLDDTDASFFGVYDGHGGSTVAEYTGNVLHNKVRSSPFFDKKEYRLALKDAFLTIDQDLKEDPNFAYDPSGCTAVTALLTPDKTLFVANAGDSRSILSINGQSKALSYDHKPMDRLESQRIVAAGGFVEFGRVNGNLALSRAIGDFEFKQNEHLPAEEQVVTCNPDIIEHQLTEDDEFIVLACDGIWDCMTNQEVIDYIRARIGKKEALETICETIMDHCLASDSEGTGIGCDNMSIIIVGILNGKTKEEWYDWMASRVPKTKLDEVTATTTPTTTPMNDVMDDSVDEKISLTSTANPDPHTAPPAPATPEP